ncbi:hypothetical protein TNCV_194401 [Trichonephila clavipes]|nr:hypothetical protein TNCV_194401 [Trichonephila clavipes]
MVSSLDLVEHKENTSVLVNRTSFGTVFLLLRNLSGRPSSLRLGNLDISCLAIRKGHKPDADLQSTVRGKRPSSPDDEQEKQGPDTDTVLNRVESMIESTNNSNEFRSKDGTVVRIPNANGNIIPGNVTKYTTPCSTRIRMTTVCDDAKFYRQIQKSNSTQQGDDKSPQNTGSEHEVKSEQFARTVMNNMMSNRMKRGNKSSVLLQFRGRIPWRLAVKDHSPLFPVHLPQKRNCGYFRVLSCRKGNTRLQTSMSSPGFVPGPTAQHI